MDVNQVEYRPFLFLNFEKGDSIYHSNYNFETNQMTEIIPL